uniref:CPBP family glutamic-type intramembrane protease n=1 Tax=Algoriphagus locisalis TaxID=305507 RepID=UPI003CC7A580
MWVSAGLSVLLFAVGHMPSTSLDWFDILVPPVLYTALLLYSGRLTASIVAHGVYNLLTILLV